ncbi:hypothetical protein VUR80DRAFT_9077 [Thermomyces stellatus]
MDAATMVTMTPSFQAFQNFALASSVAALSRDRYGCGHIWAQSVKPLQMWQRLHQWRNSCATEPLFMFWCAPKSDGVATVLITKSNFAGASGDHSRPAVEALSEAEAGATPEVIADEPTLTVELTQRKQSEGSKLRVAWFLTVSLSGARQLKNCLDRFGIASGAAPASRSRNVANGFSPSAMHDPKG